MTIIIRKVGVDYNEIVCFCLISKNSILYVTELDFQGSENVNLVDDNMPSWWKESHIGDYVVNGPDELKEFKDIYGMVTEPEYYAREDIEKLRVIREREYNRQIEELILRHFDSIDSYLEVVKRDKYKDVVDKSANNGYESIEYDEFKIDTYMAMQLETVEQYIK